MDCLRFTELASASSLSPEEAEAFEEHRAHCTECASSAAALTILRDAVAPPSANTLVGFAARVRTRVAREQLARVFSPTRSALSAAALAISAAAIVMVAMPNIINVANIARPTAPSIANAPPQVRGETPTVDEDVDLLATSEDPFASLSDDELRAVDQMMDEPGDLDDEVGT